MAMLHGAFTLRIIRTRRRNRITTRYVAEVRRGPKPVGHKVTVKFQNCGCLPDEFIGETGVFDGDENDIRDVEDIIDHHRKTEPFPNPFIKQRGG